MMVFTEQYRPRNSPASTAMRPAWICDQCLTARYVRVEHQPETILANAREVRAAANRKLMKARFIRARASRAVKKISARKPKPE